VSRSQWRSRCAT